MLFKYPPLLIDLFTKGIDLLLGSILCSSFFFFQQRDDQHDLVKCTKTSLTPPWHPPSLLWTSLPESWMMWEGWDHLSFSLSLVLHHERQLCALTASPMILWQGSPRVFLFFTVPTVVTKYLTRRNLVKEGERAG